MMMTQVIKSISIPVLNVLKRASKCFMNFVVDIASSCSSFTLTKNEMPAATE